MVHLGGSDMGGALNSQQPGGPLGRHVKFGPWLILARTAQKRSLGQCCFFFPPRLHFQLDGRFQVSCEKASCQ